jgi:subtilisin-like proprotein convertase family protein/subtilisin family serine protease
MSNTQQAYTYRAGQKIILEKQPNQFVVRALPDELANIGISEAEQVSSASSRVTTRSDDLEPLMSQSRYIAPTHHAYYEAETGQEFLITDRVFVTFRESLPPEQVDEFAGRYGLIKTATYGDRDYLFQLTDHTGMNPVKLVVTLTEQEPLVESAEHDLNQRMTTYQLVLPTDPAYARQWHLHTRFSDSAFDPRSSAQCEAAWKLLDDFGSEDVVVGVTDDGCKMNHPDFNSPGKFAAWGYLRGPRLITSADIDASPTEMYKPGANHGTSCAGVIAGEVDAMLTAGAAPDCRLLPIQWESSGPSLFISDSKLLSVLNFVADKVDILSNSWGGVPFSVWIPQVITRITELARNGGRRGRGIVFLWAAGNENCPIHHNASVNIPYTNGWSPDGSRWVGVDTAREFRNNLVGIPGLMHVAALASTARRSHYSNYGTGIMISAPTSNSHKYWRLSVRGLGITTTTGEVGGITERFGGTSSATPLVAGIAALTISANPELTALEVVSILKQTASKDLSLDGYPRTPPASFDPNPAWDVSPVAPFNQGDFTNTGDAEGTWSPWFGHGRVDAQRAVAEALRRRGPSARETFRKASTPELAIPDNRPAGVRDTIRFTDVAAISSVKVTVDITHTYIGDLRVTLTGPQGTSIVLHEQNGGNAENIRRTFDPMQTPALSALVGRSLQGDWTLHIQDLAAADVGRLNRWELEIEGQPDALVELEDAPGAVIPDDDETGIERTFTATSAGWVKDVEVTVEILHTYIGDLVVELLSPAGTNVALHNRAGGPADNLFKTYAQATTPRLQDLRGEAVQGAWRLKVSDREAEDIGKLKRWALKIVREPQEIAPQQEPGQQGPYQQRPQQQRPYQQQGP